MRRTGYLTRSKEFWPTRNVFGSPRLTVELLPATTWGSNLRSVLRVSQWDKLRRGAYEAAQHRCEICGGAGNQYRTSIAPLNSVNYCKHWTLQLLKTPKY